MLKKRDEKTSPCASSKEYQLEKYEAVFGEETSFAVFRPHLCPPLSCHLASVEERQC
jgi:hypothetical protein